MKWNTTGIKSGEIYLWDDILKSGLDTERFVKMSTYDSMDLNKSIVCHEQTYFPGITFHHFPNTNKFVVEENNFSASRANRINTIRDVEWEIESLENKIWSCKMEENNFVLLHKLQDKLQESKRLFLNLLNNRDLKQCA